MIAARWYCFSPNLKQKHIDQSPEKVEAMLKLIYGGNASRALNEAVEKSFKNRRAFNESFRRKSKEADPDEEDGAAPMVLTRVLGDMEA